MRSLFSGVDIFLSYLPEFHAKTESSVNPLPHFFCVRSLADFVSDLPEELLLFPVRALRHYVSRTASVSPHPLFVSPRAPSRPLSKNALSFFLQHVITRASSSSTSPSGVSSASSSLPSSSSSFRAHSIQGVATSWAFARNASLSSILAAST